MRTTRIVAEELPPNDLTPEPWAVEWSNKLGDFRHTHDSKAAALQHVTNLLRNLEPDQSKDEVLTVIRRG